MCRAQSESSDGMGELDYGVRSAIHNDAGMLRQSQPLEAVSDEIVRQQNNPTASH